MDKISCVHGLLNSVKIKEERWNGQIMEELCMMHVF